MNITDIEIPEEEPKEDPRVVADENTGEALQASVSAIAKQAEGITVTDAESAQDAAEWLRKLKATQKDVDGHFEPVKKALYTPYKEVLDKVKALKDALSGAESKVKRAIGAWQAAEDRKRREREAEQRRKEAEARAKADAERKAREAEAAEKNEPAPPPVPEPVIAPPAPEPEPVKLEGVSMRDNWQAEVVDFTALPDEYKLAKASQGKLEIPGVKWVNHRTVAARA
jgi:hypothetical protein